MTASIQSRCGSSPPQLHRREAERGVDEVGVRIDEPWCNHATRRVDARGIRAGRALDLVVGTYRGDPVSINRYGLGPRLIGVAGPDAAAGNDQVSGVRLPGPELA